MLSLLDPSYRWVYLIALNHAWTEWFDVQSESWFTDAILACFERASSYIRKSDDALSDDLFNTYSCRCSCSWTNVTGARLVSTSVTLKPWFKWPVFVHFKSVQSVFSFFTFRKFMILVWTRQDGIYVKTYTCYTEAIRCIFLIIIMSLEKNW